MKIGILVEDLTRRGGTERASINLANMLSKNKEYEVELITFNNINKELPFFIEQNIKIERKNFPSIGRNKLERIMWYFRLSSYFIRESKRYDCLIGTTHLINIFGILFKNKNIKYISCEHANYMAIPKLIRIVRKIVYKYSDRVIVLTWDDYNKYSRFLKSEKLEIIPNSLSSEVNQKSELNNNVIIAVGRLVKLKGYNFLFESLQDVFDIYPDWKLKLVGDGPEKENLINLAKKLGISKNIIFKGEVKNVIQEYLTSDFLVLSSEREGFPMVLLEAMQCGLPVIAFDCPTGPKEIITSNEDGILVEHLNKEKLTEAIFKLIENKKTLKKYSKKALEKSNKYSEKVISKKWIKQVMIDEIK